VYSYILAKTSAIGVVAYSRSVGRAVDRVSPVVKDAFVIGKFERFGVATELHSYSGGALVHLPVVLRTRWSQEKDLDGGIVVVF
jgi:hypothetical protein